MSTLYLDPIKTINAEPDVVASAKGSVVPKVVGRFESAEKVGPEKPGSDSGTVSLDNPRSDKTVGQSSMNVVDKDIIDKSIRVLVSQILGIEHKSDVVPDVTTSFAQTNHYVEIPLENLMESMIVSLFQLGPLKNLKRKIFVIIYLLICLTKKKIWA